MYFFGGRGLTIESTLNECTVYSLQHNLKLDSLSIHRKISEYVFSFYVLLLLPNTIFVHLPPNNSYSGSTVYERTLRSSCGPNKNSEKLVAQKNLLDLDFSVLLSVLFILTRRKFE